MTRDQTEVNNIFWESDFHVMVTYLEGDPVTIFDPNGEYHNETGFITDIREGRMVNEPGIKARETKLFVVELDRGEVKTFKRNKLKIGK